MGKKTSAGILAYRRTGSEIQVLLGHPGGPFYLKKDLGVWSIPKGELSEGEPLEVAAVREFAEEVGFRPDGVLLALPQIRQRGGKQVICFATELSLKDDELQNKFKPGPFSLEWPPKSGKLKEFPEIDRVEYFSLEIARDKILASQLPQLESLVKLL